MRLELVDIEKSFGEKRVLKGISLTAEGGRAFGLLGRNGAGKTTTLRILMGVISSDAGKVLFDGKLEGLSSERFGYLPEERGLYPKKKIFDQLVYFATLKGMRTREAEKAVDYWLGRLGMSEYKNKRLDTLSKGNQQKIQLITALAHDPEIVILDEPFSGLDPVNARLLKDVVRQTIARGKIVLFSSHQMNYIEEFCDEIAILNGGKIVLSGGLDAIKRSYPRNRLAVRSLEGERIAADFGPACERISENELLLTLPDPGKKAETMKMLSEKYDIDGVSVSEPSLNDIFVQYAGGQE